MVESSDTAMFHGDFKPSSTKALVDQLAIAPDGTSPGAPCEANLQELWWNIPDIYQPVSRSLLFPRD